MKVLIAPDKFKGSLTAREAAEAMAAGVRAAVPGAKVDLCPLADGGEGLTDTLIAATGGRLEYVNVCGPLPGMKVRAAIGWLPGDKTAVVEMAAASGLMLLPPAKRDPTRTTTFGTGELIAHAVNGGATKVIVGVGGSATTDAGLGIAQACGASIRLRSGKSYAAADRKLTGADLAKVVSISRRGDRAGEAVAGLLRFAGVEIIVAADVGNPLHGPDGAAVVFSPQKGATAAQVRQLDDGLRSVAERLKLTDFADQPAAGAGGGVGFGLMALFSGVAEPGATLVFDYLDLQRRLRGVDLCLTGEGRFDVQSLAGKTPIAVAEACRAAGVPCVVLAGALGEGWEAAHAHGVTAAWSIVDGPTSLAESSARAEDLLKSAAEQAVRLMVAVSKADKRRSGLL